jgi:hypothetical protein
MPAFRVTAERTAAESSSPAARILRHFLRPVEPLNAPRPSTDADPSAKTRSAASVLGRETLVLAFADSWRCAAVVTDEPPAVELALSVQPSSASDLAIVCPPVPAFPAYPGNSDRRDADSCVSAP